MEKILNWIKNHKRATLFICIVLLFLPLIVVHVLFKWKPGIEWIAAEWSAGDVLAYIAGFEAFIGTAALGLITVYQSKKANDESERLSKENNYLQKISIQRLLPLVKVTSVEVQDSCTIEYAYEKDKTAMLYVSDHITPNKRETHIETYLPALGDQAMHYKKVVNLTIENISDSPIHQIRVDRIEFSGFRYKGECVPLACCVGMEKYNCISNLLFPGEALDVTIDIFFDNVKYKNFWEYAELTSVGNFDICLYITNISISGITYKEKIYIEKPVKFVETVMYKAYEEDAGDA